MSVDTGDSFGEEQLSWFGLEVVMDASRGTTQIFPGCCEICYRDRRRNGTRQCERRLQSMVGGLSQSIGGSPAAALMKFRVREQSTSVARFKAPRHRSQ